MSVGVMTVEVMSVREITVGVMTVGVMRRSRYTMGKGQNTMGREVDIPWIGGSKYYR